MCETSLHCSLSVRSHILGCTWYLLILTAFDIKVIFIQIMSLIICWFDMRLTLIISLI